MNQTTLPESEIHQFFTQKQQLLDLLRESEVHYAFPIIINIIADQLLHHRFFLEWDAGLSAASSNLDAALAKI